MSPLQDTESKQHEMHTGHELETGVLARAREWIDVFPWLRLWRTLRLAGSPSMILMALLTLAVWSPVYQGILGEDVSAIANAAAPQPQMPWPSAWFSEAFWATGLHRGDSGLRSVCGLLWTLFAWSFASLVFVRQGGVLTAGRPMIRLNTVVKSTLSRCVAAWIAGIVPMLCVAALAVMIWSLGWIAAWLPEWGFVQFPIAVLITVLAIPCGILAFGGVVAIAFAWAAIANERDPDALDALSRGYEYLFRRPVHLILYGLVSLALLWIVMLLISGVTGAATEITLAVLDGAAAPVMTRSFVLQIISLIPIATAFTFAWGLIGGVYLLIRFDAGGQQVEDLWMPTAPPAAPLPTLPT
ncbi:membrane protein containing [Rhodopirellula maiorica SM1]|uniref:Membrane protein containing n=1 Tax=Rhodopirellula maiorica SM1 TaxID=1265738 RepID=M5RT88_9BACT|nr:hypothetical protein [Rhodopirellula maiorica]EMI22558.1 membrane protein containing [Rhodopirellula maiorica SM1]